MPAIIIEDSDGEAPGLNEQQANFLDAFVKEAIRSCLKDDPRDFHYGLFVLIKEKDGEDGTITSVDMLSSLPKDMLHEVIRHWIGKATH